MVAVVVALVMVGIVVVAVVMVVVVVTSGCDGGGPVGEPESQFLKAR